MVKMLFAIISLSIISGRVCGQQQDPVSMRAQMNAADQQQSAADTTLYKTPLKTYQQYYSAFTGNNSKSLVASCTDSLKQKRTDGANPSDQDYINIDAQLAQAGFSNFQLLSFTFTVDPKRPKITFHYSCSKGQGTVKEQVTLTMVDTSSGWKIDAIDSIEK